MCMTKRQWFSYTIFVLVLADYYLYCTMAGYRESAVYQHNRPEVVAEIERRYGIVMLIFKLLNLLVPASLIGIWLWLHFGHKRTRA